LQYYPVGQVEADTAFSGQATESARSPGGRGVQHKDTFQLPVIYLTESRLRPKMESAMNAVKVKLPDNRPLARLHFDRECPYPGWYVHYRLKGKRRKLALSTWDPEDLEGARAEAAKLLHLPSNRVAVEGLEVESLPK
jgi:hypothetical protein